MRYDMAIIGTGPAGISAALTAAVRRLNFLLIGSGKLSEKISRAERIENYPGLPSVSGEAMAAVFRQQLTDAGCTDHGQPVGVRRQRSVGKIHADAGHAGFHHVLQDRRLCAGRCGRPRNCGAA